MEWRDSGLFAGPDPSPLSALLDRLGAQDQARFLSRLGSEPDLYAGLFAYAELSTSPGFDAHFLDMPVHSVSVAGARLVRLGDSNAANWLINALGSATPATRISALRWLRVSGAQPGLWTARLAATLTSLEEGPEIEYALDVLARHRLAPEAHAGAIVTLVLEAESEVVAEHAVTCLATVAPSELKNVAGRFDSLDEARQLTVLSALMALGPEPMLHLVELLVADVDAALCRFAAEALSVRSEPADEGARRRLLRLGLSHQAARAVISEFLPSLLADLELVDPHEVSGTLEWVKERDRAGAFVPLASTRIALVESHAPLLLGLMEGAGDQHDRAADIAQMMALSGDLVRDLDAFNTILIRCVQQGGLLAHAAVRATVGRRERSKSRLPSTELASLSRLLGSDRPVVRKLTYRALQLLRDPANLPLVQSTSETMGTPLWVESLRAQIASGRQVCEAIAQVLHWCVAQAGANRYMILDPWIETFLQTYTTQCSSAQLRPLLHAIADRCAAWSTYEFFSNLATS